MIRSLIRLQYDNHPVASALLVLTGFLLPFIAWSSVHPIMTTLVAAGLLSALGVETLGDSGSLRILATLPLARRQLGFALWAQAVCGPLLILGVPSIPGFIVVLLLGGRANATWISILCLVLAMQQATLFLVALGVAARCNKRQGLLARFGGTMTPVALIVLLFVIAIAFEKAAFLRDHIFSLALASSIGIPVLALLTIVLLASRSLCSLAALTKENEEGALSPPSRTFMLFESLLPRRVAALAGNHLRIAMTPARYVLLPLAGVYYLEYIGRSVSTPDAKLNFAFAMVCACGAMGGLLFLTRSPMLRQLRVLPISGASATAYLLSLIGASHFVVWIVGVLVVPHLSGVSMYAFTGWVFLGFGACSIGLPLALRFSWMGGVPVLLMILLILPGGEWVYSPAAAVFYCRIGAVFFVLGAYITYTTVTRSSRAYRPSNFEALRDFAIWGDSDAVEFDSPQSHRVHGEE